MVRTDTYLLDRPNEPPHRTYDDAKARKEELRKEGWRVKIRKQSECAYEVYKKHDELFHKESWRDKSRQT